MSVINTNVKALYTQAAMKTSGRDQASAMEQLSTGKRINSAKDDAAGMAIATRMTQQIRSLNQAVRNAGDAISLIQTTEGASMEITDMMQRMRELAIQAINDTNAGEQRDYLDLEFQQLKQEIVRISDTTEWNGFSILNGTAGEAVGERPVYKTTSQSDFGTVTINPTTLRTVSGADAGEQQNVTFTGTATAAGTVNIAGVNVSVAVGDEPADIAAKAKTALGLSAAFGQSTGRTLTVSGDTLEIEFGVAEKNVGKLVVNVGGGVQGITAVAAPPVIEAQAQVDVVKVAGTIASGNKLTLTVGGEAVEVTATGADTPATLATSLAAAINASTKPEHEAVSAKVSTASVSQATSTANVASSVEIAEFDFTTPPTMAANDYLTIGGITYTASATQPTTADLVAAFTGGTPTNGTAIGTLTGYTAAAASPKVTFTADSAGSRTDLTGSQSISGTVSTVTPAYTQGVDAVAQVDTLTTANDFVAGQQIDFTVNAVALSYTVSAQDIGATEADTRTNVANKLAETYNASADPAHTPVTATANAGVVTFTADAPGTSFAITDVLAESGVISLTATVAGEGFTAAASATGTSTLTRSAALANVAADDGEAAPNRVIAKPQVDSLAIAGTIADGEKASVTVGGVAVEVTAASDTAATLAAKLANAFNISSDPAHTGVTAKVGNGTSTLVSTVANVTGINETATYTLPDVAPGGTFTIAGLTYTDAGAGTTAADLHTALTTGTPVGQLGSVSGAVTSGLTIGGTSPSFVLTAEAQANITDLAAPSGTHFAGFKETATYTLGPILATEAVTIAGRTVTATVDLTAEQLMTAFESGTDAAGVYAVTGTLSADWTIPTGGTSPNLVVEAAAVGTPTSLGSSTGDHAFTAVIITGVAASTPAAPTVVQGRAPVAQKDTITLNNDFVAGQEVSITVGGVALKHTVGAADIGADAAATRTNVALKLAEAYNASQDSAHNGITAAANGGVLTLTADVAGVPFTATANAQSGVISFTADVAGEPFTATAAGTGAITATQATQRANIIDVSGEAITATDETFAGNGKFLRSGGLSIRLDAAGTVSSTFLTTDNETVNLTGVLDGNAGTVTFEATGDNTKIITDTLVYTFKDSNGDIVDLDGRAVNLDVDVRGTMAPLDSGDLVINGITIGASYGTDDKLSPANNAAGSAIAKAAAINRYTEETGVNAVVNTNTMTGTAQSGTSVVSGRVVINGVTSPTITTVLNNTRESRNAAIEAINRISDKTGVVAVNSNSDSEGISLVAKDGRNMEVRFETNDPANDFAARTGLREGVQAGTFSLESRVEDPIVITTTSTGNIANTGLRLGDFSQNTSTISTSERAEVTAGSMPVALQTGDLVINGTPIRGATASDDNRTEANALDTATNKRVASGVAFAAAVNAASAQTGVTATANPVSTSGTNASVDPSTSNGLKSLFVNGIEIKVDFNTNQTPSERVQAVMAAVNPQVGATGVVASSNLQGGVTLTTEDGRNLSVWFDDTDLTASEFGLATSSGMAPGVSAKSDASTLAEASTLYGGVTFHSSEAFTIEPGANGYKPDSSFMALGLREGTFGGMVDQATSKMTPPNTSRLSFHVGASANQTISIDLSDFGKGGPITGAITGDVDLWDSEDRVNRIDSSASASAMLEKLDLAMDKVNGARATMGAVMNRLEHVIDNLMNVSMNSSASRSQIEDADYAAASTELARTQIMQQAATAVLAQANADQQNVLKLLQ